MENGVFEPLEKSITFFVILMLLAMEIASVCEKQWWQGAILLSCALWIADYQKVKEENRRLKDKLRGLGYKEEKGMLRFLIGYILGTFLGFMSFSAFVNIDYSSRIFFVAVWIIVLILGLLWSHKHHIKKRDDYYKKIHGPSKWSV